MLADGIEVTGASLDNGLLHIDLVQTMPEQTVRKIEIKQADGGNDAEAIDVTPGKKGNGKSSRKTD